MVPSYMQSGLEVGMEVWFADATSDKQKGVIVDFDEIHEDGEVHYYAMIRYLGSSRITTRNIRWISRAD